MKRLCYLALFAVFSTVAVQADQKKPNILFILVDDQSPFDLKVYNENSILDTPNIDRLASEGVVIDGAYHMGSWSGAVCTPSRHMIMSGRTVWHIPNRGKNMANPNAKDPNLVPPNLEEQTMAAVFNRAGFDTMRTCKKGNSYDGANKQFTILTKRRNAVALTKLEVPGTGTVFSTI